MCKKCTLLIQSRTRKRYDDKGYFESFTIESGIRGRCMPKKANKKKTEKTKKKIPRRELWIHKNPNSEIFFKKK